MRVFFLLTSAMPPVRCQISPHAARLRQDMTDVECKLWYAVRDRRLVIELDGGQHSEESDARRTAFIESAGYRALRFWNNDVLESFEGVLGIIKVALAEGADEPSPA